MTCRAGNPGGGAASAAPRPGSVHDAAAAMLAEFAGEQRLIGSMMAHESFDGILAEHALALEEVRDELGEAVPVDVPGEQWDGLLAAIRKLEEQIQYIHALGSVAEKKETNDAQ